MIVRKNKFMIIIVIAISSPPAPTKTTITIVVTGRKFNLTLGGELYYLRFCIMLKISYRYNKLVTKPLII